MIQNLRDIAFLGNSVFDYLICVFIILAGFVTIKVFQLFLLRRLRKWAEKTATTFDDFVLGVVKRTFVPLAYLGVIYLAVNTLVLDPLLGKIISIAGIAILTIFTARLLTVIIDYGFKVYWEARGKNAVLERSLKGILNVIKLAIWGLAVILLLDNLGFKVSAVIAGLGIGGVAVALAAQAILGDLFSYFAIVFDRPFEIGDFIIIGEYLGTIEYIGVKTTRIRSLGGEQLIFSNADLTNSRVRNYKRMKKRRVVFKLGVTYQTTLEQLKLIPGIIEKAIKSVKDTAFDRAHFRSYGDFSLVFEIVYYVLSADYNKYMNIQQEINFIVKKEFEAKKIEFAYPTQTVFLDKNA